MVFLFPRIARRPFSYDVEKGCEAMMNQNRMPQRRGNHPGRPQQAKIEVTEQVIEKERSFQGHVLLVYKIVYPQFSSSSFVRVLKNINQFYELQARKYALHCEKKLFKMALEQYEYSVKNRLPIQRFEAQDVFTLTYNRNCTLSLYQDRYEYTGGAHGSTVRRSNTWNLQRGGQSNLVNYFPYVRGVQEYLIGEITRQVENQIENGSKDYFDDYEENIRAHFNPQQFYLTEKGVVLYFQQYDIAPYVSGIPEFLIPYSKGGATPPTC